MRQDVGLIHQRFREGRPFDLKARDFILNFLAGRPEGGPAGLAAHSAHGDCGAWRAIRQRRRRGVSPRVAKRQKSKESDGSDDRNDQPPSLPRISDLVHRVHRRALSGGIRHVPALPHELGSISRSCGGRAAAGLWSHVHVLRRDRGGDGKRYWSPCVHESALPLWRRGSSALSSLSC
jgi:hypothetical protein